MTEAAGAANWVEVAPEVLASPAHCDLAQGLLFSFSLALDTGDRG